MYRKAVEVRGRQRAAELPQPPPAVTDIADLMDGLFYGTPVQTSPKKSSRGSQRSSEVGRQTEQWLEEARRAVAMSPKRYDSPSRLVGSPRFAAPARGLESPARAVPSLDRRHPLARSARRHRMTEGIGEEILLKSTRHSRNKSDVSYSTADTPPASTVQQWLAENGKERLAESKELHGDSKDDQVPQQDPAPIPRQPSRRSRFGNDATAAEPSGLPIPTRRVFKDAASSSALGEYGALDVLSPPKSLLESARRSSILSSTCSSDRLAVAVDTEEVPGDVEGDELVQSKSPDESGVTELNSFLQQQRSKLQWIARGEALSKAKIVLSGSATSTTSSMVASIGYAWLLEKRATDGEGRLEGAAIVAIPVMNMKRKGMWAHRQAAWLFRYLGVDVNALLFADEVDLEDLMKAQQLSITVVGRDVLRTDDKVGSRCTLLTDNYCEDAYDLLEIPVLKKLLLAGVLLDTQNLNRGFKFCTARDAEAAQLLTCGLPSNYRNELFYQLMTDHNEASFMEFMSTNYGKSPTQMKGEHVATAVKGENGATSIDQHVVRKQLNVPSRDRNVSSTAKQKSFPAPAFTENVVQSKAQDNDSRGKNKFFLAKWFGFGSK